MKNKEIEELLNKLKNKAEHYILYDYEVNLLLSYIEELEEDNKYLKRLCETQNNREYRSKFLKEFQEEKGENVYPDYDEIYKRYDRLKEENKQLENNRDKAIEVIDLITPELWNISNAMTYKLKDIKYILKGDSDENIR